MALRVWLLNSEMKDGKTQKARREKNPARLVIRVKYQSFRRGMTKKG
jgi:hypothetical protein